MLLEIADKSVEAFRIKEKIYYRYRDMVMPCIVEDGVLKIKTVLYWSMVKKKIEWINNILKEDLYKL